MKSRLTFFGRETLAKCASRNLRCRPLGPCAPTEQGERDMTRSKFRSLQAVMLTSMLGLGTTSLALAQEAEEEDHWYDDLSIGAFVDAYGALRSDRNSHPGSPNQLGSAIGGYYHEAYTQAEGFALAFAGAD